MPEVLIKNFKNYEEYKATQMRSCGDARLYPEYQRRNQHDMAIAKVWWPPESKILDAGCGDGYAMDLMREAGFRPLGIDFSTAKTKVCVEHGHIAWGMDFKNIPEAPMYFDVVYHRYTFEHLIEPIEAMKEFYRVLRSGGRLTLITRIGPIKGKHVQAVPSLDYVVDIVKAGGFSIDRAWIEKRPFGQDVWVYGRKR